MQAPLFQNTLGADHSLRRVDAGVRRSLLFGGLRLLLANARLLLWAWLASLLCGLFATLPFAGYVGGYLDHSLAAQEIAGRVDLAYIAELVQHAHKYRAIAATPALLSVIVFTLVNFILVAGALFVFQAGARPRLSVVADAGIRYFFRFIRLTLVSAVVIGLILWALTTLRDAWLAHASKTYVGSAIFLRSSLSMAAIFIIVLLLRFYFDLAESVVVKLGLASDRRVRRSFPLTFRLLRGDFTRSFLSYFLSGGLGFAIFALCVWSWVAAISPHSTAIAFLLGQLGIASLLAARLWQRASLASLVLQNTAPAVPIPEAAPPQPASKTEAAIEPRTIW
ncbi:MAG TPA: hypothetical protein VNX22_02270 [Acidobacteriaceae bacterium]|nr:hypothetical protein [Acidobacteriaceae bacterium]